jgi:hypothetical protein
MTASCDTTPIGGNRHQCRNPRCLTIYQLEPADVLPIYAACKGAQGVGDHVADLLTRLGVRKGAACGCQARQRALNRLGWQLRPLASIAWLAFVEPFTRRDN